MINCNIAGFLRPKLRVSCSPQGLGAGNYIRLKHGNTIQMKGTENKPKLNKVVPEDRRQRKCKISKGEVQIVYIVFFGVFLLLEKLRC